MPSEVKQLVRELRSIVSEADPTFAKGHRIVKEYEFSNGRKSEFDYHKRGPYDPTQNVEEGLQDRDDVWPDYDSATYDGVNQAPGAS